MKFWTTVFVSCILTLARISMISSFQMATYRQGIRSQNRFRGTAFCATPEKIKFNEQQQPGSGVPDVSNRKGESDHDENDEVKPDMPNIPILSESESLLAMDPSTIEVIPFDRLSEEGKVLGGAYSGTDHEVPGESSSLFGFVNMFRGSANYIANHRNTIIVYHIPGELLEWDGFNDLMDDIALSWLLGMKPVIVAGCRAQINSRMPQGEDGLNNEDNQYDSVRITDLKTLRIVQEEAGYVRFEIERRLGRSLHRHGMIDDGSMKDGNVVSGNFFSAQPFGKYSI